MRRAMIVTGAMLWASVAAMASIAAADEPGKESSSKETAEQSDDARILGTWLYVSKIQKGVESKQDDSSDNAPLDVTFAEQSWKTHIGPKGAPIEIGGGYSLDPKQTPKLLDLTVRGDGNSTDVYAIYKLDQDQLSIRIREGNGTRPVDFDSPADDCITLVFRREGK